MDELNPEQRAAVEHGAGPLLVLAGAGTGKTRVIAHRIAALVGRGARPSRILAVTFTNKAADEMRERVRALLPGPASRGMTISTFHALCLRILREEHAAAGLPPGFGICDEGDRLALARRILRELPAGGLGMRPAAFVALVSRAKGAGVGPDAVASGGGEGEGPLFARAYRRYEETLRRQGLLDFDDLLLRAVQLLRAASDVRRRQAGRFDHLLVDEFQDTNGHQAEILRLLAEGHANVCVVGDDDQSIYAWRGARVENLLSFGRRFPGAAVVRLERNYRSAPPILQAASLLIRHNRRRRAKRLVPVVRGGEPVRYRSFPDDASEAEGVADEILGRVRRGARPSEHAVLYRTNPQSRPFEQALRARAVPCVVIGGISYFDRKEVRDLLAYLRILRNPDDDAAWLRVLNVPARGVGDASAERIVAEASRAGAPVARVLAGADALPGIPAAARRGIAALRAAVEDLRGIAARRPLSRAVEALVERVGYRAEVEAEADGPEDRLVRMNAVSDLARAAEQYERRAGAAAGLSGFLDESALIGDDRGDKERRLARDAVVLITLHSAKGLEFPRVYLSGAEEGLLPHAKSVEQGAAGVAEERRLCYVGVTRAMRSLTLTAALSHPRRGRPEPACPSRFLAEMGLAPGPGGGGPGIRVRTPVDESGRGRTRGDLS